MPPQIGTTEPAAATEAPLPQMFDRLGRPGIAEAMREQIAREFAHIPEGKRGALLIVSDFRGTRAHVAAKVIESDKIQWKVAAGAGWEWQAKRPVGYVGVEALW